MARFSQSHFFMVCVLISSAFFLPVAKNGSPTYNVRRYANIIEKVVVGIAIRTAVSIGHDLPKIWWGRSMAYP